MPYVVAVTLVDGKFDTSSFADERLTDARIIDVMDRIEIREDPVLTQIGKETGVKYVDVLRDDDLLGTPGDPEHTFLALMQFDFVTMVRSLGGDPAALEAVDTTNVVTDNARYPQ